MAHVLRTPPVGAVLSTNVPPARRVKGGSRGLSLGVFSLWLLQRGCHCQNVSMATLFYSYNNASAPLPLRQSSSSLWAPHSHAHAVVQTSRRGLCDRPITLGIMIFKRGWRGPCGLEQIRMKLKCRFPNDLNLIITPPSIQNPIMKIIR